MTSCQTIQSQFDDRLDGQLDAAAQRDFEAHVATCPVCARQWQAYAAAWQILDRPRAIEPSFGFTERTLRRLTEDTETEPWFWLRWSAAMRGVAAALLVASVGTAGWVTNQRVNAAKQARFYADVQQADYLEDYDVIEHLDQLNGKGPR